MPTAYSWAIRFAFRCQGEPQRRPTLFVSPVQRGDARAHALRRLIFNRDVIGKNLGFCLVKWALLLLSGNAASFCHRDDCLADHQDRTILKAISYFGR
jgi:hypothetical protein